MINEAAVSFFSMRYESEHGVQPSVDDIPHDLQVLFGKKVFKFADYRDKHHPKMTDGQVYEGCCMDHLVRPAREYMLRKQGGIT